MPPGRHPSAFVSASSIETAVGAIAREQIRRLVVTNAAARARDVSFALCADVHGALTTLAGGMEEPTALGLLADVSRILRLGRRPAESASEERALEPAQPML